MRVTTKLLLGILLALEQAEGAVIFEAVGDFLVSDVTTSSTTPVDTGLSVSLAGYTGDALVVSSYSAQKSTNSNPMIAYHQNYMGSTAIGQTHTRSIQKSSVAAGAGSAIGIASVSGGATFNLRHHKNVSPPNVVTISGSNLSVIPLTSGTTTLAHASTSSSAQVSTSLSTFSQVSATTAFTIAGVYDGTSEIFIMASLDVSSNVSGTGTWQLQYRNASTGGSWINAGNQGKRSVDTASGVVTLVALADVDAAGDYQVRLVQASDGTAILTTQRVDLVGLSLAIDAGNYLPSYQAASVGVDGATISVPISGDMSVFAAANITANSTQNDTGIYSLFANDGTVSTLVAASKREVDSRNLGSIALSGIIDMQAIDSNSLVISDNSTKLGFSPDSNFVAFGLTSVAVPEPATVATLLGVASLFAVAFRRNRKTKR